MSHDYFVEEIQTIVRRGGSKFNFIILGVQALIL